MEVDEGPSDGRPTSNAADLQGTQKKIVEWTKGPLTAIPRPVHQISPELQLGQTLS